MLQKKKEPPSDQTVGGYSSHKEATVIGASDDIISLKSQEVKHVL